MNEKFFCVLRVASQVANALSSLRDELQDESTAHALMVKAIVNMPAVAPARRARNPTDQEFLCGPGWDRTIDRGIMSPLL